MVAEGDEGVEVEEAKIADGFEVSETKAMLRKSCTIKTVKDAYIEVHDTITLHQVLELPSDIDNFQKPEDDTIPKGVLRQGSELYRTLKTEVGSDYKSVSSEKQITQVELKLFEKVLYLAVDKKKDVGYLKKRIFEIEGIPIGCLVLKEG